MIVDELAQVAEKVREWPAADLQYLMMWKIIPEGIGVSVEANCNPDKARGVVEEQTLLNGY